MEEPMHLIIDGYSSNQQILQDEVFLRQMLDSIPSLIGMTKITEPFVFRYVGDKPEDWGISGFVFIAESHISFHTFVERSYINIDVFSCRDFDIDQALKHFQDILQLIKYKSYLVNRDWNAADLPEANKVTLIRSL
jgi:S-adenosylmethionine decarboxylase